MHVVKRDGRLVEFNKKRIIDAIVKAMNQTKKGIDEELAERIATSIEKQLENRDEVSIYEIQDLVEKKLMVSSRKEVATTYITYRYTRDVARKSKTKNVFLDMITCKSDYNENTSSSYQSINVMMDHFVAESIKPYVDTVLLSKDVKEAEHSGFISIENKNYYPTKAIRSFKVPLSAKSKLLKDCNNVESAVTKILLILSQLTGEVCEEIILPPVKSIIKPFEKKTREEEKNILIDVFGEEVVNNDEKYLLVIKKNCESRVNNSIDFLLNGLSIIPKRITFLENEENEFDGSGVVNAVKINLPNIALKVLDYTRDTDVDFEPKTEANEEKIIEKLFYGNLKKLINISLKSMIERFNFQATAVKSQFPILMSGLWLESDSISETDTLEGVLRNGTLELEICGIDEAINIINEKNDVRKAEKIKNKIIKIINDLLREYSKEYELNFIFKEVKDDSKNVF